tara:strand:- start:935 stop:1237 length:303 start_codon:yes stop_codon:yes gene_type:complete
MKLPNPPLITENGDYDITVEPGSAYLLCLKGNWSAATTVTLKTSSEAIPGNFNNVIDGVFTADTEQDYRPPSDIVRLSVTGADEFTSLEVDNTKHLDKSI